MSRLVRVTDWEVPNPLYLMVACGGGLSARVHCYRVIVARPADGEDNLVAYCPARMALVPAEELIPAGAAFDLLANPSLADLVEARARLELEAAGVEVSERGHHKLSVRLVELEIRSLIRKSEGLVAAMDRGEAVGPAERMAWLRNRERAKQLFRRWSGLTGIPVLFDFDL